MISEDEWGCPRSLHAPEETALQPTLLFTNEVLTLKATQMNQKHRTEKGFSLQGRAEQ